MKKSLMVVAYPILSIYAFGYYFNNVPEINSKMVTDKGKQYMSLGVLSTILDREGTSRSTQHIDVHSGNGKFKGNGVYEEYKTESSGLTIGTTSQFLEKKSENLDSKWITGVSIGYIKSDIDYLNQEKDETVGTIGINSYLGYYRNTYFSMIYLGAGFSKAETRNFKNKRENINFGLESGKIFNLGKRHFLYPYLGADFTGYFMSDYEIVDYKYKKSNEAQGTGRLGVNYYADYAKFLFRTNANYSISNEKNENYTFIDSTGNQNKINRFELTGRTLNVSAMGGYYIAEDLLLSLEIQGVYNNDYNETIYGLRVNYTF